MDKNTISDTAKQYDRRVYLVFKITLIAIPLMAAITFVLSWSALWATVVFLMGLLICTTLVIVKGAITGNRYAQGAKKRRSRWLGFLYSKKDGLEDDVFKCLQKREEETI